MITEDAETGTQLSRSNLVKGYEFKKNTYLLLSDEDLASVKVESSSMMAIEKFVSIDSIDPIYYDTSYFLAPDGEAGRDVYAVLRQAIFESGRVALSRVVMAQRERTIALRAADGGIVAHTLYEQRDINDAKPLFEHVDMENVDAAMVTLAKQLIDRQAADYDPADLEDRYEARLRAMIDAKLKGEGIEPEAEAPTDRSNVIDLMAALKQSLSQGAPQASERQPVAKKPAAGRTKRTPKAAKEA